MCEKRMCEWAGVRAGRIKLTADEKITVASPMSQ